MSLQIWFWIFYVLSLFYGFWTEYAVGQPYPYPRGFRHLLFYILIGILGWRVFGSPIK
jgi:hypothetical protein